MPTTISNEASSNYQFSGSSDVVSVSSNISTLTLEDTSGLLISKTANPSTFANGDIITYTITITNNTSSFLTGVRIIDNLGGPNRLAYVIGSGSLSTQTETYPVTPIATSPLTFTLQQLASGASMTLTYRAQVFFNLMASVSSITNSVQGIGYTSSGTVTGFDNSTISRTQTGSVSMSKSTSDTSVFPNQVFNYTISMENNTSTSATNVTITDELPLNFEVVSITLQSGSGTPVSLLETDYSISSSNVLTVSSVNGSVITIPADGALVLVISGYFA